MERFLHEAAQLVTTTGLFLGESNGRTRKLMAELDDVTQDFMAVIDCAKFETVYLNARARELFCAQPNRHEFNFSFWMGKIHSISLQTLQRHYTSVILHPQDTDKAAILVRPGDFMKNKWLYAVSKVIAFDSGKPKLIGTVASDIEAAYGDARKEIAGSLVKWPGNMIVLTRRQKAILRLMLQEYTTKQIAAKLLISEATVDAERTQMLRKVGVKSMVGLIKYALDSNLV
jgi:DNA-binding CsgD family transcriptional regulator